MSEKNYRDIFLSHRSTNKDFIIRLANDIESQSSNGSQLLTWVDEAEIRGGQSIVAMVNQGLEQSRFIALALSPEYFTSESGWTDAEWHSALYGDPDNRGGLILPLLIEDCPQIPYLLRHLKMIDFRENHYSDGLAELLSILRNEPRRKAVFHRGQLIQNGTIDRATIISARAPMQAEPDAINENLFCNLLPVESLPKHIYTAPINSKLYKTNKNNEQVQPSKRELIEIIKLIQIEQGVDRPVVPSFRCFEEKIITFHNLDSPNSIFNTIIDFSQVEEIPTHDFLQNEDDRNLITSLLNMSLTRHLQKQGLIIDDTKHGRFFFPLNDGGIHEVSWTPFRNKGKRTVAKPYMVGEQVYCWLHQGAYLKMLFLANNYYLQILPTWVVTEDGRKVKGGNKVSRIVNRWTSGERNLSILYHIRFWTFILNNSNAPIQIRVGDQAMMLRWKPAFVQLEGGIINDHKDLLSKLDQQAEAISEMEEQFIDMAVEHELEAESETSTVGLEEELEQYFDDDNEDSEQTT